MRNVYLDYSATTPVKEEVLQEMIPYYTQNFGNPSSLYTPGLTAKKGLTEARQRVADLINAEPGEIYFTSCGTEADNWVLEAQKIFMNELAMTRNMVYMSALMSDLWNYLNTIKWGGSLEIQMAIGQSITLVTPVAELRYAAALVDGSVWNLSLIDSITSPEGEILSKRQPQLFNKLEGVEEYLPYIKEGMKGVVDETGTAKRFFQNWQYRNDCSVNRCQFTEILISSRSKYHNDKYYGISTIC